MSELFPANGVLRYEIKAGYGYRVVAEIDQEISNYYRALIPKWIKVSPQMYPAHVSVVRKEIPTVLDFWGNMDGEVIELFYENQIQFDNTYLWLNTYSTDLEEIRSSLGLPVVGGEVDRVGFRRTFHITIGNFKR